MKISVFTDSRNSSAPLKFAVPVEAGAARRFSSNCRSVGCPFFIAPVGGDTVLGEWCISWVRICTSRGVSAQAHHGGMQRLIPVGFGIGDVVVEGFGQGMPQAVDDADGAVAIRLQYYQDPEGKKVVNIVEMLADGGVLFHFLVDAVNVLGPAGYLALSPTLPNSFFNSAMTW